MGLDTPDWEALADVLRPRTEECEREPCQSAKRGMAPIVSQRAGFGEIAEWSIEFRAFHSNVNPPRVHVGFRTIPRVVAPSSSSAIAFHWYLPVWPSTRRLWPRRASGQEGFCSGECCRSDMSGELMSTNVMVRDLDIASPHKSDLQSGSRDRRIDFVRWLPLGH